MQLTQLGPYKIEKPLGKGGMGSVYEAIDTQTSQRVAIKALTPHLAMAEGFRERFEAEIESLKILRHEGIVRLFGYGEQDGVLFYSMELVDGTSLEDELRAGRRFNWREVTSIAIQLSLALKHAHDHGIVHRDIKPANILLYEGTTGLSPSHNESPGVSASHDERVKLADFGIARLFGTTQLTTAGGVLGTADYMSPEQADGRPVTPRCDQYSLGCVMYALLAGRPPFVAKNLPQMLQLQRFAKPEPVRRYAEDAPEQLERVITQLLAKDPAERFPNTQVLARHLQAMVRALSRPAADDFALAGEPHVADHADADFAASLAIEPTQADVRNGSSVAQPAPSAEELQSSIIRQDAPTLAAEDLSPGRVATASPPSAAAPATQRVPAKATDQPARFTTIEEEEALQRAEHRRPWLVLAAQVATPLAVLAAVAAVVLYLSQPPTADSLYQKIVARVEDQDDSSRTLVYNDVEAFLTQYPNDPRAVEVQQYKEDIELDRLERKLDRQARRSGADPTFSPIEQLYLQAVSLAETEPDAAVQKLQSIVDLYGPQTAADGDQQVAVIVELSKRRLKTLEANLAEQRERQLKSLRERLAAAEHLSAKNPRQASEMYRAIIDLHDADAWAAEIVATARSRLEQLEE